MLDIHQGAQVPWSTQIKTKNKATGRLEPLDLTGFEEIQVCFVTGGTPQLLKQLESLDEVIVDNLKQGEISGFIEAVDSAGMPVSETGNKMEGHVDFGDGVIKKFKVLDSHRVIETECPVAP